MKTAVPIKKTSRTTNRKGTATCGCLDGTEAQLSRGRRLKTKIRGHLKEKPYEICRPIIEASTG